MEVTIIFEDSASSPTLSLSGTKASINKRIKLNLNHRVKVFTLALVIGFSCVWLSQFILGIAIVLISSVLFYVIESLDHALKIDLSFSEIDRLNEAIAQDLLGLDEY